MRSFFFDSPNLDLQCSRKARLKKALVGRAVEDQSAPILGENKQAWKEHPYRPMRAVKGSVGLSLREAAMEGRANTPPVLPGLRSASGRISFVSSRRQCRTGS